MFSNDDDDSSSQFGIRMRRRQLDSPAEEPVTNASGIEPRAAKPPTPDLAPADAAVPDPETPVTEPVYSEATRTRPAVVDPQPRRSDLQATQDALDLTRSTPARKQSRGKAAILNMLYEMSGQANQALSTGRPIDEYALAGVVGKGIGGAGRGAVDPAVNNERKRKAQMAELSTQIQQQLATEKAASETQYKQAEAEWYKQRPGIEARKAARTTVLANLRLLAGQQLDPNIPQHAQLLKDAEANGIQIDPGSWNDRAQNVAYFTAVDPNDPTKTVRQYINKTTKETGTVDQEGHAVQSGYVQPVDSKTGMTANQEQTLNQRQKEFATRSNMSEREYTLKLQTAKETERHHLETERAARAGQNITITRTKINYGAAKARAKALGISLPDYESMMDELGVDVVDENEKK